MEIEYQSNGLPKYIGYEDLKEKLGYIPHKSKLGALGRAILSAHKESRSNKVLKMLCDSYYTNALRRKKRRLETLNGMSK